MTEENKDNGTSLVKVEEYHGLVMHCSPAESLRRMQELQAFVKETMVSNIDFGLIPGTQKPTLYQPGAQKLCEMYGLASDFSDVEKIEDWKDGFFYYKTKCTLTDRRTHAFIGNGIGSCNSKEDRYAWRWVKANQVPKGVDINSLKQKDSQYGTRFRLPNDDIFSLVNTIQKMASKRALMHAVLGATRSAGIFGQDMEDLPADVIGQVAGQRTWEKSEIIDVDALPDMSTPAQEPAPEIDYAKLIEQCDDTATLNKIKSQIIADVPAGDKRSALFATWTERGKKIQSAKKAGANPQTGEVPEPGSNG